MAAKSFKQMVSTKEIRRADAYKVRLEDLHEEPGLNWRRYTDAFHKSVEELAELIAGGMEVDPLEVRPREEGGVWIVTGHRRTRAWRLLDLSGRLQRDPKTGEFLVSVVPSKAKDRRQRLARVSTSQDQFELTPLDYAEGCRRMHEEEGMTPAEIAAEIKKTRQRVEQFLKLATASEGVKALIDAGKVSASTVTRLVRKHGPDVEGIILEKLEAAKARGKKKVTPSAMADAPDSEAAAVPHSSALAAPASAPAQAQAQAQGPHDELMKVVREIVRSFPTEVRAGLAEGAEAITVTFRASQIERLTEILAKADEA